MRFTKRDSCGNGYVTNGHTLQDALNRLATLEDWWETVEKEGAVVTVHCRECEDLVRPEEEGGEYSCKGDMGGTVCPGGYCHKAQRKGTKK